MNYSDTLRNIYEKLDELGDLPVFSATINRIQQVSSSEESDAMALAMAIMKDVNLSSKLLMLANSPTYHRGNAPITVVSRAVVLIGFKQIKNLCLTLKLIEGFHQNHPDLNVPGLLMRAFLNANIASGLAMRSTRMRDAEEAYINALLFGLGEIIVAHTMPAEYRRMLAERKQGKLSWRRIQLKYLGGTFSDVGQDLARSWGHPPQVIKAMGREQHYGEGESSVEIASLGYHLLEQLYGLDSASDYPFSTTVEHLSNITGLTPDEVSSTALSCYQKVAQVASDYGLSCRSMVRTYAPTGDEERDEVVRQMAFISAQHGDDERFEPHTERAQARASAAGAEQQLEYLQQVSEMINQKAPLPKVLQTIVEAIASCSGMHRTQLCLLNRAGDRLEVKIVKGRDTFKLRSYFSRSRDGSVNDMFFRVIERGATLLVNDVDENGWHERIPPDFLAQVRCQGFVMAPLVVRKRVIGMLYSDRLQGEGGLSDSDFKVFNQFATQAHLALLNA